MKFYLTKAAQRAAESGQAPVKAAKAPRVVAEKASKPEKAPRAAKAPRAVKTARVAPTSIEAIPAPTSAPMSSPAPQAAPAPWLPASAPTAPMHTANNSASVVQTAPVPSAATALLEAPAAPKAEVPPNQVRATKPAKAAPASRQKKGILAIGGQPRVDLLPLEVRAERKAGQKVRRAWLGVAAVVVLVGIATGGATLYAQGASTSLAAAQASTSTLSAEGTHYSKAKTVQDQVDLIDAAQRVGGSTDIDWSSYLSKVALTVPAGASLSAISIDSANPVQDYAQASAPLQGQRVATLTLTATSAVLPSTPTWLENLATLPGYEDGSAGTITFDKDKGIYTAVVTIHLNKKAFSHAYSKGN